ncbi:MAG: sulfur carrier protein ThiS [Porphyromonadaceae bacterium]|nr:sulfur carrier protein ThiS [Porphyromonadaceae bacterium]
MTVVLNGKTIAVAEGITLVQLLTDERIDTANTAIAVNNVVISRSRWAEFTLSDNSKILLIKATQGG